MDKNAVVRLALDINKGVNTFSLEDHTYSAQEAEDVLRKALIDANGGSAEFNYKALRRNKVDIFEIIEELIPQIINSGLEGNEFWVNNVDYKNIALGDKNEFFVEDDADFVVSIIADGIATPRRQRLTGGTRVPVETSVHAIRIYEEFSRFMSGRIDWNALCTKVAESFQKAIWNDIYTAFSLAVAGSAYNDTTDPGSGTYGSIDEDDVITMINHVEAATGKTARIIGTQAALKALSAATTANFIGADAKADIYNQGFFGKFYGTDCYLLKQVHAAGSTDTFALSDKCFYVIASDDKFIKFVDEGETIIDDRDWTENADMTIEYRMFQRWGVGVAVAANACAKYTFGA